MGSSGKDAILTPASSAQGDVLYRSATVWTRLAAGTSGQTLQSGGAGANPSWAAAAAGAVTREGGNLVEATTTSNTPVDLLTASGMSIAAARFILILANFRKNGTSADWSGGGLKLNATVVGEAIANGTARAWASSTVGQNESGTSEILLGPRSADYATACNGRSYSAPNISGTPTRVENVEPAFTTSFPTVAITDVIMRGITSIIITLGADELNVYSYANS